MRPGTTITIRDTPPARSAPTDTGTLFAIGETATVPATQPVTIRSITEYETAFGDRTGDGIVMYDAVDVYLREGGSHVVVYAVGTLDDTTLADALDALPSLLGPGQVIAPGALTTELHTILLTHAEATNRIAVLDAPDDATASDLLDLAAAVQNVTGSARGALFAPWAVVPGLASGVSRTVPYSAIAAAQMAVVDAAGNPNVPAAGVPGESRYATGLAAVFTDAERDDLNDAGVNLAKLVYGGVRTYGFRTVSADTDWSLLNNSRLLMAVVAHTEGVAERFVFSQLDGKGRKISEFGGDLTGVLIPLWQAGALYGDTARDAFRVDVGSAVNTAETIAAGELRAVLYMRMSPFAEQVKVEIVKVATTSAV